jgi:hypothetical protein
LKLKTGFCALLFLVARPEALRAIELEQFAGSAHAYPVMFDLAGKKLANAEFTQQIADGLLHVRITYDQVDGGRIEERASFRQRPELVQKQWSWQQHKEEALQRRYMVDFDSGKAVVQKREKGGVKDWSEQVKITPGRTFAGFGFTFAAQNLRDRLVKGEVIELQAIGFTPKPRVVTVTLDYHGTDRVPMSDRVLRGEHFVVRPNIPAIAKLFIKVPDTHIWLTPPPPGFLRWQGPLVEPSDPLVRVDLVSSGESRPAKPSDEKPKE